MKLELKLELQRDKYTMYEKLMEEGTPIQDLLRGNASNVGDIGELLALAADYIDMLEDSLREIEAALKETVLNLRQQHNKPQRD